MTSQPQRPLRCHASGPTIRTGLHSRQEAHSEQLRGSATGGCSPSRPPKRKRRKRGSHSPVRPTWLSGGRRRTQALAARSVALHRTENVDVLSHQARSSEMCIPASCCGVQAGLCEGLPSCSGQCCQAFPRGSNVLAFRVVFKLVDHLGVPSPLQEVNVAVPLCTKTKPHSLLCFHAFAVSPITAHTQYKDSVES